jgi:hypothetical protein
LTSFDITFPLEIRHRKKPLRNGWITQGIKMSSIEMRFLNTLKKQPNLTEDTKMYIAKYKMIYKRVIREAKRGEMIRIYCMQLISLKLYSRL